MGNIIGHLVDTNHWPPNHANKKHWCYAAGSNPNHHNHYCDDPEIGSPQYDTDFDYSVFRCREARCQTCLDLSPELYPARGLWPGTTWKKGDPQSREIHVTSKSLLESTLGGCKICSVLKEGLDFVSGSKTFVPDNVFCVELLKGFTVRVTHETRSKHATEEEKLVVELYSSLDEVTPLAWKSFGAAERVKREIGVSHCVDFINSSIKKCLKHPKCAQSHSSSRRSKLPTRLIDVGAGKSDVRLETSPKVMQRYIALSHAWGTLQLPATTTANLRQHCENIPWVSLSRTFQDAISITRGLGIRYIWIDSLCIIQDSSSDWEAEAEGMGNVYANSYLTFSATSAADSSEGLLRPRYNLNESNDPEYLCEYEIKQSDRLSHYSIYARRAIKYSHKFLLSLEYKGGHKELAPLLYRAWVLQERILSPRTLHFSFDEMVWECKTGIDCECGFAASHSGRALSASPLGLDIFKELFNNGQASNLGKPDKVRKFDHEEELFSAWYRLVEYYMALSLTFPADRLPALRGMTRSLEEKLGWTYLEGIWAEDVVPGLLWRRNWLRSFKRNDTAPSWSWASMEPIDGSSWDRSSLSVPAVYDLLRFVNSARDIHVHERFCLISHSSHHRQQREDEEDTSHQTILPEGRAYIVVEALFIHATVVAEPSQAPRTETADPEDYSIERIREEAERPGADEDKLENDGESKALRLSVEGNKTLISVTWDIFNNNNSQDGYDEVAENDEVAAILLTQAGDDVAKSASSYSGLVLKKVVLGGSDLYKRLGDFSFAQEEKGLFLEGTIRHVVLI